MLRFSSPFDNVPPAGERYRANLVLGHLAVDKKHADGRLRWVLPTSDGVTVRDDIESDVVERAASSMLAAGSAA